MNLYKKYIKRALDIILSLVTLVILSPFLVIIAILIKIKLGSPVIFKQERPGKNEKIFSLYKFRTMTNETDEKGNLLSDSKRLTKFGKLLRSTSLDELPEIINILKGEMSFVGPRPLAVSYLPYYSEAERQRHEVNPGLTGLAQVNGRNTISWEKRFEYDVLYVNELNFILDIKILLKTIKRVVQRSDIGVAGIDRPENFNEYRIKQNKNNISAK